MKTLILYTCEPSIELYSEGKIFFAEDKPLEGDSFKVEVESSVSLQIIHEIDGIQVFEVYPEQVLEVKSI